MDRRRSADTAPAPLQALPVPPKPRLLAWRQRLLALWQQASGAVQAAAVVLAAAAALAVLASALQRWAWPPGTAWGDALAPALAPLLAGLALAGLAGAAAAALLAQCSSIALQQLAEAARALRREEASDDAQLPLLLANPALRGASQSLRRLVDHARNQRRALQARNAQLGSQLQQRTHELCTLQDLSVGLAGTDDFHGLVDEALKALEQTLEYSSASVWARDRRSDSAQVVLTGYRSHDPQGAASVDASDDTDGAGSAPSLLGKRLSRINLQRYEQIEQSRVPLIDNNARQSLFSWLWEKVTDDASTSRLYRSTRAWMGLPLRFRDEVLGVMRVDHQEPGYFDAERARLLGAVCSQTALAMHHARLLVQERELAVVAERNRIARDLHDAVSQTLFASNVIAGTLAQQAAKGVALDPARLQAQAASLERLNRGALAEMRMLLFELRPDALEHQPLADLLRHPIESLSCRGDMQVLADLAPSDSLAPAARVHLYRIAQEALSNIGRHSGASRVQVSWLPAAPGGALLSITDNGQGFDPSQAHPGHFGLDNMRSRAADINATLILTSQPGQGCEISVHFSPTPSQDESAATLARAPKPVPHRDRPDLDLHRRRPPDDPHRPGGDDRR